MGTWSVIEQTGSRAYSLGSVPSESSVSLVYLVRWIPASGVDTYPGEATLLAQCPGANTRLDAGFYGTSTYLKTMVIRAVEIQPMREQAYTWRVTAQASTRQWGFSNQNDFCTCTRATVVRSTSLYRKGASFPTDGTVSFSGGADIGGSRVDTNGKAKTYEVPQQLITIEVQYDRTLPSGGPAAEPPWATYTSYVGTRNLATFLGAPKGTLLYQGFQTAPIDSNYYRLSHTFLYDAWYHLEQIPAPNPSGEPFLIGGVSIGSPSFQILQVKDVVWLQKYDSFAAFSSIVTAAQLAALTAPEPVAIP